MKRRWTEQEVAYLREHWKPNQSARDIADALGRTLHAIYNKANKLGLEIKGQPNQIRLSDREVLWLKLNFPHMRNEICAMHLGVSLRMCSRLAHGLNLKKTPQFMAESQRFSANKARESHIKNGTFPPKGVLNANLAKGEKYRFKPKRNETDSNPRHSP